jgi:hypothetical protein
MRSIRRKRGQFGACRHNPSHFPVEKSNQIRTASAGN